jgi:purine-nucleoside phosphorylase
MNLKQNVNGQEVESAVQYINNRCDQQATTALVLGTGLGKSIDSFNTIVEIPYSDIPFSPISTVEGHSGKLILANNNGKNIWVLSGRMHIYEGYTASQSTFMIHVLAGLGVVDIYITNAVGGVNPHYSEGEIILINDHINFFPDNPLRGLNDDSRGPRFTDMSTAYCPNMLSKIYTAALQHNIKLKTGVYFGWPGPTLETPAEYRMIHIIGADVVGMSSIPEVIVARYYEMKVCMLSVVSNVCFPKEKIKLTTIDSVIKVMNQSALIVGKILSSVLQ